MAIAGLTSPAAAFCLQVFGQDAGLRMVFRAEHRLIDGTREHVLTGPAAMLTGASLDPSDASWGGQIATLIAGCPGRVQGEASATVSCAGPLAEGAARPLVSWVLARVRRRHA